jgi:hypothetical protein
MLLIKIKVGLNGRLRKDDLDYIYIYIYIMKREKNYADDIDQWSWQNLVAIYMKIMMKGGLSVHLSN